MHACVFDYVVRFDFSCKWRKQPYHTIIFIIFTYRVWIFRRRWSVCGKPNEFIFPLVALWVALILPFGCRNRAVHGGRLSMPHFLVVSRKLQKNTPQGVTSLNVRIREANCKTRREADTSVSTPRQICAARLLYSSHGMCICILLHTFAAVSPEVTRRRRILPSESCNCLRR